MRPFRASSCVGIALSPDRLVAMLPGGRRLETADVADLGRAFADLKGTAGIGRAAVTVALVPPLVQVRHLTLPPLREEERRRVLNRDAARYFAEVLEPQVVGAVALAKASPVRLLVAATSSRLVLEIETAVVATGWRLAAIVPAHAAWVAWADTRRPKQAERHVVVRLVGGTEVLRLESGKIVERRRFRAGDADRAKVATTDPVVLQAPASDPLALAAEFAPHVAEPELYSEQRGKARRARAHRVAALLAVGAALCLVVSGGLHYWGLTRELSLVRARRTVLAARVAAAMQLRDSLAGVAGGISTLDTLEAGAPRWSAFFADLADYLPRNAHLVALRGRGDSVVIEGIAQQAASVFQALQQMPAVAGMRAEGPIRQEVAPDGVVSEQFGIATRLRGRP